jgi:hypothetical protein
MTAVGTKRSVGWICGAVVFWALTAWLILAGVGSIVPQIFWPATALSGSGTGCAMALRDLSQELLAHTANTIKNASSPAAPDAQTVWFREFDERLENTGPLCTQDEQSALHELLRVRHGLSALLERFEREDAPRTRALDAMLADEVHRGAP